MEYEPDAKEEPIAYLLGLIRAGTYPWVAARATSIPDDRFRNVMASQSKLRTEVFQAQGQARAKAEIDLKEKNPLAWLRYGLGRPSRDGAGWTGTARAAWDNADATDAVLAEINAILAHAREFGEAHPDVRVPFAAWMAKANG